MKIRTNPKQIFFEIPSLHGGRRRGAGRKKRLIGQPNHEKRPRISSRTPLGVTLKLQPGLQNLRSVRNLKAFARAFRLARRYGLRVVHFSLQSTHAHLIVEANDNQSLERGMRSLTVAIAHAINRVRLVSGRVFHGRYHLHVLKSPTEVRRALHYVLFNLSKHLGIERCVDPYSSIYAFERLEELTGAEVLEKLRVTPSGHRFGSGALS